MAQIMLGGATMQKALSLVPHPTPDKPLLLGVGGTT